MSVVDSLRSALHSLLQQSASPPEMKKKGPITAFSTYHGNGQRKAEMQYMCGKRHGEWRFWDDKGRPIKVQYYEDGELLRTELPEAEVVEA